MWLQRLPDFVLDWFALRSNMTTKISYSQFPMRNSSRAFSPESVMLSQAMKSDEKVETKFRAFLTWILDGCKLQAEEPPTPRTPIG